MDLPDVEARLHEAVSSELQVRTPQLSAAALRAELKPVCRVGSGSKYASYIEATIWRADGEVHDVLFLYVAREGRVLVEIETAVAWFKEAIADSLGDATSDS